MRTEIKKFKSKKGVTLVELVVGIAIIAIIFASTLGAMVGGYTTTIKNADQNKAAVLNASLNEIIINTVRDIHLNESSVYTYTGEISDLRITDTVAEYMPEATYVKPNAFPNNTDDYQYTIQPVRDTTTQLSVSGVNYDIKGIMIKTCFESAAGPVIYQSFVPFTK